MFYNIVFAIAAVEKRDYLCVAIEGNNTIFFVP